MDLTTLASYYPGYRLEDRSVAITELPGWVWMLTLMLAAIPAGIFFLISSASADLGFRWVGLTFVLVFLHEGTHAVAWKLSSGLPWSSFTFGIQWKTVTPYCHSVKPMDVRAYRIGAIMPLLVTGILPWIIGLVLDDADLAIASAILISGAGGDLYILWSVKDLPAGVMLQDHDEKAGCIALWPEEAS
ncbi:MAG: DUF3267 domain-containing protein [Rhodothermales bacterium]